jgi:hypothetical protein
MPQSAAALEPGICSTLNLAKIGAVKKSQTWQRDVSPISSTSLGGYMISKTWRRLYARQGPHQTSAMTLAWSY